MPQCETLGVCKGLPARVGDAPGGQELSVLALVAAQRLLQARQHAAGPAGRGARAWGGAPRHPGCRRQGGGLPAPIPCCCSPRRPHPLLFVKPSAVLQLHARLARPPVHLAQVLQAGLLGLQLPGEALHIRQACTRGRAAGRAVDSQPSTPLQGSGRGRGRGGRGEQQGGGAEREEGERQGAAEREEGGRQGAAEREEGGGATGGGRERRGEGAGRQAAAAHLAGRRARCRAAPRPMQRLPPHRGGR
jgi:hypothetical protein